MRPVIATAAAVGSWLLLSSAAPAQTQAASLLSGVRPGATVEQRVDTSKAITPIPALPAAQNRFNFASLFSKALVPDFRTRNGSSPLPSPSSFPVYQNFRLIQPPAYPLAWMFGDATTAAPGHPLAPVIP